MNEVKEKPAEEKKPFDAGDPEAVKARKRELKGAETLRLDALKAIMGVPNGRAYMWWLLGQCGIYRSSFAGDPHRTAFNEGQRNIGLIVFAELHQHCAGDYQKMVAEAQQLKGDE